jgi:hypothetical protein
MLQWLKDYISSPTHQWWVEKVWRPSWTRFVTFLYGIPAALLVVAEKISDWAKDDTIANYMSQIGMPNWIPSTLAAVALVYYIAHGRD